MTPEGLAGQLAELVALPQVVAELRQDVARLQLEIQRLQPAPADDLLDVEAAAQLLDMTPGAVRRAASRGTLPVVRLGRRVRFRRSALLARLQGGADE